MALLVTAPAGAISDADKCEVAKNKIAGKYALCREQAEAKAIKMGSAPDYSACDAKLSQKWLAAEAGGGMCPTSGDEGTIQTCIAAATTLWAAALIDGGPCAPISPLPRTGQTECDLGAGTLGACPGSPAGQDGALMIGAARSYTDNGDGTITDNVTGLMWEKLSDDLTVHNAFTHYTWDAAFTGKIAELNSGGGFAGHTDWRMPNRFELKSLVDQGRVDPAIDPIFNTNCTAGCAVTTCSCTESDNHWSSTNLPFAPDSAWYVDFNSGFVADSTKTTSNQVRAVRHAP